jgi:hypothetical protein
VSVSEPARTATEPERRASATARRDEEGTATRAATRIDGDEEVVAALQVVARLLPEEEDEAASELAAESGARREASMVSETEGRRTAEVEELPLLVLGVERKRKECVREKKRGGRKKNHFRCSRWPLPLKETMRQSKAMPCLPSQEPRPRSPCSAI